MQLNATAWGIIIAFFALSMLIGLLASRRAGKSFSEYFLSGRNMPWWLLGFSMVATTFSSDTPNLVTDIVRTNGIAGNWVWWAFLLTGMLTVFVYARLWRRSGILTDLEFYELRYSGRAATFLRGFRAIYLGVFFNVAIMATVSLAAIKIGGVLLGWTPEKTLLIAGSVTVLYTMLGGLRGVIWTDFFQFILAMTGMVLAAVYVLNLPEVGGLSNLLQQEAVSGKLNFLPDFKDHKNLIVLLIIPLAVQWWSVWYPGAEPGGGGYIVQRMLSAKNEQHAVGATLFFNIAHYALRPWPWILIALASLMVFPMDAPQIRQEADAALKSDGIVAIVQAMKTNPGSVSEEDRAKVQELRFQAGGLTALRQAFPKNLIPDDKIGHDLAFPAMLGKLPPVLLGLLIAALIAAFMSTISTHLNWGSSYIVNDFYRRFFAPEASDKQLVLVGRLSTVVLMLLSALLALRLSSALGAFNILLQIGAGTGLIFILRWFWWRISAYSEITAMVVSFFVALYFQFSDLGQSLPDHVKLVLGVAVTTVAWVSVTLFTRPTAQPVLLSFYKLIRPHAGGWRPVIEQARKDGQLSAEATPPGKLPRELACMIAGCFMVYGLLFATGYLMYSEWLPALAGFAVAAVAGWIIVSNWKKING
jgi:solute:Na+ symporter, SSS family